MSTTTTDTFSSNEPRNGGFIVYLNGIEVPCKGVSEREGIWQIPEMQVEMVADPVLTRLGAEDRVQVVVFYVDDTKVDKVVQPSPTLRLFGEGEIIGWGYKNTPSGRSIVFTCHNQFAIFQQLYVQFLTNLDDMVAHATDPGQNSTGLSTPTSQIIFPFSLFKQGLIGKGPGQDPDSIRHPFDFLYNVVRNMIGAHIPTEQRSVPASNFFARWARLTNFVNRFVATPSFDEGTGDANIFPVLKALQTVGAVDVIARNLAPQMQNQGSIMDMLQLVYQTVLMEVAMLPRMPLVTVDLKTNAIETTSFEAHKLTQVAGAKGKNVTATAPNPLKPNRIANYFAKPQLIFGIAPSCNVFFPSQVKMLSYEENYATQPTRLYFNDEVLHTLFKMDKSGLGQAIMNALTNAWPPAADAAVRARYTNPKSNGKNFLLFPEEFFKGPVMDRRTIPQWLYFLRQQEMTAVLQGKATPGTGAENTVTGASGVTADQDALFEQLKAEHPDVYKLYAEYEYYRERYSKRSGSAVLAFNPYVVPGFPAVIFDNRATRVDLACYVVTVQQSMTHRSRDTSISFAYGRTLQEMFDLMASDFQTGAAAAGAGPREPILAVRQVIQGFDEAEAFYKKLFYGNRDIRGKAASFDFRKVIAYEPLRPGLTPERIYVNGVSEQSQSAVADAGKTLVDLTPKLADAKQKYAVAKQEKITAEATIAQINQDAAQSSTENQTQSTLSTVTQRELEAATASKTAADAAIALLSKTISDYETQLAAAQATVDQAAAQATTVSHNLRGDRELVALPGKEGLFNTYDDAMSYNWRPICTLEEYIIFHDSAGESLIPAFGHKRSIGVAYYERIRRLSPLVSSTSWRPVNSASEQPLPTGFDGVTVPLTPNPDAATQGAEDPVTGETAKNPSKTATVTGITSGSFPQTRADWDKILLAYRQNAYNVLVPRT